MNQWKKSFAGLLAIAALIAALVVIVHSPHPLAQPEQTDDASYYGFLNRYSPQLEAPSPMEEFFNRFNSPELIAKMQQSSINRFRPFRQWRRWANTPQNPALTLGFILSFALCTWLVVPSTLRDAEITYRVNSFQSFLYGAFATTGFVTLARAAMISGIGWPAGIVLIGVLLLALFTGLAIAAASLGKLCSRCLGFVRIDWLVEHPSVLTILELIAGCLILAACISIPGIGAFPPFGTRLVSLLSVTAFGALFKSLRDKHSQTSA